MYIVTVPSLSPFPFSPSTNPQLHSLPQEIESRRKQAEQAEMRKKVHEDLLMGKRKSGQDLNFLKSPRL